MFEMGKIILPEIDLHLHLAGGGVVREHVVSSRDSEQTMSPIVATKVSKEAVV